MKCLAVMSVIGWMVLQQACNDSDGEFKETLVLECHLTPGEDCKRIPDVEHCLSKGFLDLNHPVFDEEVVYRLLPLVYNNVDESEVVIEKCVVGYEWLVGRAVLEQASKSELLALEDMQMTVYSAGTAQSVLSSLDLISGKTGALIRTLGEEHADSMVLGIHVRIYGTTQTGIAVESNELVLPIEICWGCLDLTCCSGEQAYYPSCTPGQDDNGLLPCDCPKG